MSTAPHTDPRDAIRPALADELSGLPWDLRQRVALACRILAAERHCFALAGQVTVRAEANSFWTVPWSPAFDAIGVRDVIRIDDDLNPLEGSAQPNPAVRFHYWIYRARPEVECIVHTHPPAIAALSMLGRPLVVSHMDTMPLYDDVAFLRDWPGVPVADQEGEIISAALGGKKAILLAHHGLIATGRSVQEATVLALMMEHAADLQLRAEATGGAIAATPDALAREAREFLLQPSIVDATFRAFADRVLRSDPATIG
ncbi:aldolase [Conexibacter arvalis]|uniref:L-fuculose-phosphate aldolase n=1 Tax=Conexibacter arvalis TaxID=912552 RepID=A0A840I8V4_9ACTN|nr:aldolase [Conexibacter arvalis]MBB4660574.1 L-fuculose-phosphate aldolase [Conexibacter arvalis]